MSKNKDGRFNFRLTECDREKLNKDSSKAGISASEYLRKLINNRTPSNREDFMLIKELVNEMNAIGNNINQIAKNFNSGFFDESEKSRLIKLMESLVSNTEKIIQGEERD